MSYCCVIPARVREVSDCCEDFVRPNYLFAGTISRTINVVSSGTNIPLPDYQIAKDIAINSSSTIFSITTSGVYRLVYHINLEERENVSTRLTLNGIPVEASVLHPVAPENKFSAEVFLNLRAGDAISLQYFNADQAIPMQLGIGATLSIVKEN